MPRSDRLRPGNTCRNQRTRGRSIVSGPLNPMDQAAKDYALKVLRELGFKPYFLGWYDGELRNVTLVEFVSYPYMIGETAYVKARTEIGEPTSMADFECSTILTASIMADRIESGEIDGEIVTKFLHAIAKYTTTQARFES